MSKKKIDNEEVKLLAAPQEIEDEVIKEVENNIEEIQPAEEPQIDIQPEIEIKNTFTVYIGTYPSHTFAQLIVGDMKYKGFKGNIEESEEGYVVHAGIYSQKQNAVNLKYQLEAYGYKPEIK